ncbi:hypothetical protein F4801DRAFT_574040 [Xylaria longipes]|nr:hypothetical protein F4801DRAFT_574040 [Xylaria longipes]
MVPPRRLFAPKFMTDIAAADELPSSMCFLEATLERHDPFAYSVLDSAKKMGRVEDATLFEQVFKAYSAGDLEGIKSRVHDMREEHVPYLLRMLAMRGLLDRRPGVLEFCLNRDGFGYESNFVRKVDIVDKDKDPETFKVLEESDFRKLHPLRPHPAFDTDVGGRFPVDW